MRSRPASAALAEPANTLTFADLLCVGMLLSTAGFGTAPASGCATRTRTSSGWVSSGSGGVVVAWDEVTADVLPCMWVRHHPADRPPVRWWPWPATRAG